MLFMFVALLALLATGIPVVYALAGIGILATIMLWGIRGLSVVVQDAWLVMISYTLVAVPMFIFMADILKSSGVAEDLFRSMRLWFGRMPGGLAIGVVAASTIIAAMSGVTMTGVVTMGILALPIMLRLGYDKTIAIGPILAGGALAVLIPPSVTFVFYGQITQTSIGRLFLGGIIPGLLLALFYAIYIGVACRIKPHLGPPLPPEELVSLKGKIISLKALILPTFLIFTVLGTMFMGIASPTEAASAGAAGALICALVRGNFKWKMVVGAVQSTFGITVMVMWIMIGAYVFKGAVFGVGGAAAIEQLLSVMHLPPLIVLSLMSLSLIILGCFVNEWTVLLITVPIYLPVVVSLGYDPVWFGVFFLLNMQIGYLSPPFAYTIFVLKSIAPPGVTIGDMFRAVVPFISAQYVCVLLVMFFPTIATWLPNMFFGT